MSADNYFTVKQDPENGYWYVYHGFMSNLEDGFPAVTQFSEEFLSEKDAQAFYWDMQPEFWSEYGLIEEPDDEELRPLREEYIAKWGDPDEEKF